MFEENIILESSEKSYLREKWESVLKGTIVKRIPKVYLDNDQIIFLNNEIEIKNFFSNENSENINKKKIIVISVPLNNFTNLIKFLDKIDKILDEDTKIIINYFSISWKYIFKIFSIFNLTKSFKESLFFSKKTFDIFLNCTNYETSKKLDDISLPLQLPFFTKLFSIVINILPFLSILSFANIFYLRKRTRVNQSKKLMSLIIPCKNEENNIGNIIIEAKKTLNFPYQIVFVDDLSEDKTNENMKLVKAQNEDLKIKIVLGKGEGKSRAVDVGVNSSDGFYCIILDADLTVRMESINLFYSAISIGNGDLINGTRLVYKLEENSMRLLNIFGNKFFSLLISYITSSKVTDTLCGTKCFKKSDWKIFESFRNDTKLNDIWGDFNIIFASSFYGYKLIDLPVRYYERVSGETKMKRRFYYFLNMLSLCFKALIKFKINPNK